MLLPRERKTGFMNFSEHKDRRSLSDELHARPFSDFHKQGRFIRFIYLTGWHETALIKHLNTWLESKNIRPVEKGEKFRREILDDFIFRLERHTEFITIGFIVLDETTKSGLPAHAFTPAKNKKLPFDMISSIPCPLFHAIWCEIAKQPKAKIRPEDVNKMLESNTSSSSVISEGSGQVHFSFDIDKLGYSRCVLFSKSLSPSRLSRIVLRLIEMESYRMLALLGLPVAREHLPRLHQIEGELAQQTKRLTTQIDERSDEVQNMLPELSKLAAEIEEMSATTSYRLSATQAYRDIFMSRLDGLQTSRLDGHQSLYAFLDRRMTPAMQTCIAFTDRLGSLSMRISRAGALLRTQTDIIIQRQNTDLLGSMNRRAQAQLRLQQTVEGLSVIAGTYYGVGLIEYLIIGSPLAEGSIDPSLMKALAIPFVGLAIWLFIHRVSRAVDAISK